MDIRKIPAELLFLDDNLPRKISGQKRKSYIVNKMISSITSVITLSGQPFSVAPDYMHLRSMITLYEKWKSSTETNHQSSDEYFEQRILSYLMKICYYWWIDDIDILDPIVCYYYESHHTYIEIYNAKINRRNAWVSLFVYGTWLNSTANQTDSHTRNSPLLYFLMCYNYASLTLHGRAFVNKLTLDFNQCISMCSGCFRMGNPEGLLLLLQYGGRFSGTENMELELATCCERIRDIFFIISPFLNIYIGMSKQQVQDINGTIGIAAWQKKLLCLRLMLRVMPQVAMCSLFDRNYITDLLSRISEVFDIQCQPEEIANRLSNPRELKHLCRMRIRRMDIVSAMRCPYLPNGLKTLNLPQCLINYLNLLDD